MAPLREALLSLLADQSTCDESDLWHRCELLGQPVEASRVRAFLTILRDRGVLVAVGELPTGQRYRRGRWWQRWAQETGRVSARHQAQQRRREARQQSAQLDALWERAERGELPRRMRARRQELQLTIAEVAERMALGMEDLWKIEAGKRPLTLQRLVRWARATESSVDELLAGLGESHG